MEDNNVNQFANIRSVALEKILTKGGRLESCRYLLCFCPQELVLAAGPSR